MMIELVLLLIIFFWPADSDGLRNLPLAAALCFLVSGLLLELWPFFHLLALLFAVVGFFMIAIGLQYI